MGLFDFFSKNLRGKQLLEQKKDNPIISKVLNTLYKEGVTDEDFTQWWNMPDSQHVKIKEDDNISKMTVLNVLISKGMSRKKAVEKIFKTFPVYGDQNDSSKVKGKDKFLPYELKNRINKFFTTTATKNISVEKEVLKFSSMNAYIRSKIKNGEI